MSIKARTVGAEVELTNGQTVEITHITDDVVTMETVQTYSVNGYEGLEAPKEYNVPLELFHDVQE